MSSRARSSVRSDEAPHIRDAHGGIRHERAFGSIPAEVLAFELEVGVANPPVVLLRDPDVPRLADHADAAPTVPPVPALERAVMPAPPTAAVMTATPTAAA